MQNLSRCARLSRTLICNSSFKQLPAAHCLWEESDFATQRRGVTKLDVDPATFIDPERRDSEEYSLNSILRGKESIEDLDDHGDEKAKAHDEVDLEQLSDDDLDSENGMADRRASQKYK